MYKQYSQNLNNNSNIIDKNKRYDCAQKGNFPL